MNIPATQAADLSWERHRALLVASGLVDGLNPLRAAARLEKLREAFYEGFEAGLRVGRAEGPFWLGA